MLDSEQKLIGDSTEDKTAKNTKACVIKRKLKFQNYKNCLEATHLENKINHLEINITDVDNIEKIMKNSCDAKIYY